MKRLFKVLLVLLLTGAMFTDTMKQSEAANIKLNVTKKTLRIGKSFTLTLKNTTKSGNAKASNSRVTLSKVKKNKWKIKGKKAGKVVVTVKVKKKTYKCTITVKKVSKAWKKAYLKIVNQQHQTETGVSYEYRLIDINSDGVPELYVDRQIVAYGSELFTYYKKKVNSVLCPVYGVTYIKGKKNKIKASFEHMGFGYDHIFRLQKGKFKTLYHGEFYNDPDSEFKYDSKGSIIYDHYKWNNKKVSRSNYKKSLKKAFNKNKAKKMLSSSCDYDHIVKVIKAYK